VAQVARHAGESSARKVCGEARDHAHVRVRVRACVSVRTWNDGNSHAKFAKEALEHGE